MVGDGSDGGTGDLSQHLFVTLFELNEQMSE